MQDIKDKKILKSSREWVEVGGIHVEGRVEAIMNVLRHEAQQK